MGFSNSIIGGAAALIRAAIKSPNFVSGLIGWSVNKDGTAEFQNVVFRGTFSGTQFIISSSGAFFYSGVPAADNLIASIAAVAGTDAYGNAYENGVVTYSVKSATLTMLTQIIGDTVAFKAITDPSVGYTYFTSAPAMFAIEPEDPTRNPGLLFTAPSDLPVPLLTSIFTMGGESEDGLIAPRIVMGNVDLANGQMSPGRVVTVGTLVAGIAGDLAGVTVEEPWNTINYPTGWSTSPGFPAWAYRLDATGRLWFRGVVQVAASNGLGLKFTLPVGYRPSVAHILPVPVAQTAAMSAEQRFDVTTDGKITMLAASPGSTSYMVWNGLSISLD
jgi:hypothetical protein